METLTYNTNFKTSSNVAVSYLLHKQKVSFKNLQLDRFPRQERLKWLGGINMSTFLCKIITVCCPLHNLIRGKMIVDPLENELNGWKWGIE
ncbi:hypothetical protein ACE6H2_010227 [Prunus campanulata]